MGEGKKSNESKLIELEKKCVELQRQVVEKERMIESEKQKLPDLRKLGTYINLCLKFSFWLCSYFFFFLITYRRKIEID